MKFTQNKKYCFTITQVYYHDIQEALRKSIKTDLLVIYQSKTPATTGLVKKFKTLHVDLQQSKEKLFAQFGKTTRYQIRRAQEKDTLHFIITTKPDDVLIDWFVNFYNEFSARKGLPSCEPSALNALNKQGLLSLAEVRNSEGVVLASHAHIISNGRARLYKSASIFRNTDKAMRALIGRANRYLHAEEMWYFMEMGLVIYDFGGISLDKQRGDLSGIDKFKMGFGGRVVEEFHCVVPISFIGKASWYLLPAKWGKCIE